MRKTLLIIGNGFDLCHKFKTKYEHFLYNFIVKSMYKSLNYMKRDEGDYVRGYFYEENQLLRIKSIYYLNSRESVKNQEERRINKIIEKNGDYYSLIEYIKGDGNFTLDTFLLSILDSSSNLNWVDIESSYYNLLIKIIKEGKKTEQNIKKLNSQLEYLKEELILYLKQVNQDSERLFDDKNQKTSDLNEILDFETKMIDLISGFRNDTSNSLKDNYFVLNFNYTKTFNYYKRHLLHSPTKSIHGSIESNIDEIIFGFGDELNPDYGILKSYYNGSEHLKHIKQLYYNNLVSESLTNFLENNLFDVKIIGHSCGLSDRYILNKIFSNVNCQQIEVFLNEESVLEDQKSKRINLFQCFESSSDFNKKVYINNEKFIPQNKIDLFPIINNSYVKQTK